MIAIKKFVLFVVFSLSAVGYCSDGEIEIVQWLAPLVAASPFSLPGNQPGCQRITFGNFGSNGRFASIAFSLGENGGETVYSPSLQSDKNCRFSNEKTTLTCRYYIGSGGPFGGNDGYYVVSLGKNSDNKLTGLSFLRKRKSTGTTESVTCQ